MTTPSKHTRLDASERREQILEAANMLFAERGYDEVSIEDIAVAAGVTRGLVHHYFGGRKDVLPRSARPAGRHPRGAAETPRRSQRPGAGGGLGVAVARLDRLQPHDLARRDRTG